MKKVYVPDFNKRVIGKEPRKLVADIGNCLFAFLIAVFCIFVAFSFVYTGTTVEGPSMVPLLNSEYYTDPTKEDIAYYKAVDEYNYGDIVIAHASDNKEIIKRVVGLPGDYIEIKKADNGYYYLFRNGKKIEEDYIKSQSGMKNSYENMRNILGYTHLTVRVNELFILGDNRGVSKDSSSYGCFNYDDILGRVDYIVKAGKVPTFDLFIQMFLPIFHKN